jgi:hypothetical protein
MIRIPTTVLSVLLMLSMAVPAGAQQTAETATRPPLHLVIPADKTPARAITPQYRQGRRPSTRLNSVARATFLGAVAGFAVGGLAGSALEGQSCRCDIPGFQGLMIGGSIGAVVGGAAVFHLATR